MSRSSEIGAAARALHDRHARHLHEDERIGRPCRWCPYGDEDIEDATTVIDAISAHRSG